MSTDDRNGPVHVGDAARRVLNKIRQASNDLSKDVTDYKCLDCKDTGIIQREGRSSPCKCATQQTNGAEKQKAFF